MQIIDCNSDSKVSSFLFKAGETHVKLSNLETDQDTTFLLKFFTEQSLFKLAMIKDAWDRLKTGRPFARLAIPYFPGARQDRVCNKGEPLSVKVYADFINAMKFDEVSVFDPHSEVAPALIQNCNIATNHQFVLDCLDGNVDFCLVSPDAGSNKKIFSLAESLGVEVVRADKKRNVSDGSIVGTDVFAEDLSGRHCVIVDDIISGGRTFMELAKVLRSKGASQITLIVSHHEGVASDQALIESGINQVFATDSIYGTCISSKITTIKPVEKYIL